MDDSIVSLEQRITERIGGGMQSIMGLDEKMFAFNYEDLIILLDLNPNPSAGRI